MELPKIKVADFEGPFDLLLHLIKKNKMNIYNVEIYKVTNQYLRYLDEMKEMEEKTPNIESVSAEILVRHETYGCGKVVEEDDTMITVEFEGYGRKEFIKAFSCLEILNGQ